MANFFKDYTKKSVEKLALTEADKDLLKVKNEGSTFSLVITSMIFTA